MFVGMELTTSRCSWHQSYVWLDVCVSVCVVEDRAFHYLLPVIRYAHLDMGLTPRASRPSSDRDVLVDAAVHCQSKRDRK